MFPGVLVWLYIPNSSSSFSPLLVSIAAQTLFLFLYKLPFQDQSSDAAQKMLPGSPFINWY